MTLATAAPTDTRRRVDGLDLLRGVAVGLVLLRHALPGVFPGAGVVGVVMFFALSGYLITGLLLDEHARSGRVDLRRFYARRAWRLVPPLLLVLATYAVVTAVLDPLGDRGTLGRDLLVALTWTGNLPHLTPGGATFHLWTLATEEQFYLLWPSLLLLFLGRGRPGRALAVAGSVTVVALVGTVVWLADAPDLAYALPTSWALCFVIGAAARVLGRDVVPPCWAAAPALAVLGVLAVLPLRGHVLTYLLVGPAVAALTTVVLLSWRGWHGVEGRVPRLLVGLGVVSYAAYLWSYPLTLWLRPLPLGGVLALGLTLALAVVTRRVVEVPVEHRRGRVAR